MWAIKDAWKKPACWQALSPSHFIGSIIKAVLQESEPFFPNLPFLPLTGAEEHTGLSAGHRQQCSRRYQNLWVDLMLCTNVCVSHFLLASVCTVEVCASARVCVYMRVCVSAGSCWGSIFGRSWRGGGAASHQQCSAVTCLTPYYPHCHSHFIWGHCMEWQRSRKHQMPGANVAYMTPCNWWDMLPDNPILLTHTHTIQAVFYNSGSINDVV